MSITQGYHNIHAYGWSILALLALIGALSYYGIIDPATIKDQLSEVFT